MPVWDQKPNDGALRNLDMKGKVGNVDDSREGAKPVGRSCPHWMIGGIIVCILCRIMIIHNLTYSVCMHGFNKD